MLKKIFLAPLTALAILGAGAASAQPSPAEIRIGYVISKTGPYAGAASAMVLPNYQLWAHELEKAGGIEMAGTRVPVRFIEYDDRSNSDEAVKAIERLINQDKVDFILPPWGTAMNLAVAPILDRHGYPQLATTMISDRAAQLRERWQRMFFFQLPSAGYAEGLIDVLINLRDQGKIEGRVATVNVADQFGVELAKAAREKLQAAKFEIVYDQSYPMGTQDFQSMLTEVGRRQPEAFLAFSYPPDTLALSDQARTVGFNPKLFYTAVGTVLPIFKTRLGDSAHGVMGYGGVSPELPETVDYRKRHADLLGIEADYNISAVTYASLEILQQAITRTSSIDRQKVSDEIATGSFDTVIGAVKLVDRTWVDGATVGQWQDGVYHPVWPAQATGVKPMIFPKPAW